MSDVDELPRPRLTRGAGVIGVLAVIAGFAGGFAAGYAAHDDPDRSAVEVVAGSEDDGAADASPRDTSSAATGSVDTTAPGTIVAGASAPGMPAPPARLFRRTTAQGLSVRVFRNEVGRGTPACDSSSWCPPPECTPDTFIESYVVGEWSVTQGGSPFLTLRDGEPARVLGFASNWWAEDAVFAVVVRASADVSIVRLSSGGLVDEMAPSDGLAVLALPGTHAEHEDEFVPVPRGAVVEVVVDGTAVPLDLDRAFATDPACAPPPPAPPRLPAAGEQPSDPDAARAAVVAVYDQAFGGTDDEALAAAVDDPSGMDGIRENLREQYPEMVGGRVTYEITDIVFTSPTEAAFYFRPIIGDYGEMPRQIGGARIVDGEWKVTRATACAMFRLGGSSC